MIVLRAGKGFKDRVTILPVAVVAELQEHLVRVKALHEDFLRGGFGDVELPYALSRKYPNAGSQWVWQYVFPARNISTDPRTGARRRHQSLAISAMTLDASRLAQNIPERKVRQPHLMIVDWDARRRVA